MPFEMKDRLGIPIEYVDALEEEPDLPVTVDCQPGQRNVQRFSGRRVAAIDHHEVRQEGHLRPPAKLRRLLHHHLGPAEAGGRF